MRRARVRFLVETDEEAGENPVLAVFPSTRSKGVVECRALGGRVVLAHPDYVDSLKPADRAGYWPLVEELASAGYDLEIENELDGGLAFPEEANPGRGPA